MWNPKRTVSLPRRKKSCPRANVKGDENERRVAQWWTCKASRALVSWGTHRKHAAQKRSFSCWKAWTAHLPRHKLLSASTRSWLSMSAHQNHGTPPRHGVLSDKKSEARVADMEVFVVKGTESESSLPESLARCHGKREEFVLPKKLSNSALVQRGCQIARVEKNNEMSCVISAVKKEFYPVCQTLKKQHHSDHLFQTRR